LDILRPTLNEQLCGWHGKKTKSAHDPSGSRFTFLKED
jgi:hypothetical protein